MLGGRFLQGFQQGIDRLVSHVFPGLDEGHPPAAPHRGISREAAKLPDLLDCYLGWTFPGGWSNDLVVRVRSRTHALAGRADPAGVAVFPKVGAVQGRGQGSGDGGLAHSLGAEEEIGVGQTAPAQGSLEVPQDPFLAQDVPEEAGGGFLV